MDTPIVSIGLVLTSIVAIPLYYMIRGNKIHQKQIQQLFDQHSRGGTYRFGLVATNNRKVLGVDAQKKGLLFIDLNLKEPYVVFQPLSPNENLQVAIPNAQGTTIPKKVEWVFISKNGKAADNTILFYDADKNYLVPVYANEELKLAQQWQELLMQYI